MSIENISNINTNVPIDVEKVDSTETEIQVQEPEAIHVNEDKLIENKKECDNWLMQSKYFHEKKFKEWKKLIQNLRRSKLTEDIISSKKKITTLAQLNDFINNYQINGSIQLVWAIFVWLSNKIEFDMDNMTDKRIDDVAISNFLKKAKCNGHGYCVLFKKLCELNGIKCHLIYGYGKGYGYKNGKSIKVSNHVWTAVNVENDWRFVDVAWASGYSSVNDEFENEFQPYYFFTPPELFIYQHFSDKHQLIENKITLEQFWSMPLLRIDYFFNEIVLINQKDMKINMDSNPCMVNFQVPNNVQLLAVLYDGTDKKVENGTFVQRNYETFKYEINIQVPRLNHYKLRLFVDNKKSDVFKWAADLEVKTDSLKLSSIVNWCQSYYIPNRKIYLICPTRLLISTKEVVQYKIFVENAYEVCLIDEFYKPTGLKKVNNEKDIWYTEFCNIVKGELKLSVKFKEDEPYYTAFSYYFI